MTVVSLRRVLGCLLGLALSGAASAQSLPQGKGRAEFQRICGKCHGLEMATKLRQSADGWSAIVDDMVSRGAEGTDDELELIVKYLAANFGKSPEDTGSKAPPAQKVNVNTAGVHELTDVLGLSAGDAEAIVQFRKDKGDFKDWPDLRKVPGIDLKKLEDRKDRVLFTSAGEPDPK